VTQLPALRSLLRELGAHQRHDPHDEIVRLAIRLRARDACEYCLLPTTGQYHIDHVIPGLLWEQIHADRRRRGPDHIDNFAWCCPFCNSAKGQQVAGRAGRRTYRLFDRRRDRWPAHFVFAHNYLLIVGLPGIGWVTERALAFNDGRLGGPLGTRHDAVLAGRYPPPWARAWLV